METQERIVNMSELEELEKIVKDAQARIAELKAPMQLATMCTIKPLRLPRFVNEDSRENAWFSEGCYYDRDAWLHFLELGKMIHNQPGRFEARGSGQINPFYVDNTGIGRRKVKKISDLTGTEARISAEMLDEMIAVYNKYMVMLHKTVELKDVSGNIRKVPVITNDL
nr:hypothetical protein [uncultured Faecalimonas sp.]